MSSNSQTLAYDKRDHWVLAFIVLILLTVLLRAVYVMAWQADFLQEEGNKRQVRSLEIPAARGHIFDRNGEVLALSTRVDSIWVDPKVLSYYLDPLQQQVQAQQEDLTQSQLKQRNQRIAKSLQAYRKLLSRLQLSEVTVTQRILTKKNKRFLYLKRNVLPELSDQIAQLDVPGLYIQNEYKRYYPSGEVTAHLLGFTDIDGKGLAGVEKTYHDWLEGIEGQKQVIKDRTGQVVSFVKELKPAKEGKDIYLSIDKDIQYFLYHALKKAYIRHQAKSIQSVILDAQTGEVLASVSLPAFNPNNRSQLSGSKLRDRALTDRIEPGSPLKPFIVAKALDLGLLSVDEKIDTTPGNLTIQGQTISDSRNHGKLTPQEIIEKSSNVGASKIALRMAPEQEWQLYHDLGFGQFLGLYLPGITEGFLRPAKDWTPLDQVSASFGYGLDMSLMQLAHAYLIFTNEGRIKPVSIIKVETEQVNDGKQVVRAEVANQVLAMMKGVAKQGGTAPQARVAGYQVAGKTGTVHRLKGGDYEKDKYLSLFAGIIPATNPKYIMVTSVVEPSRGIYFGGLVAAPIFSEVMTEVVRIKNVPPDDFLP